MDIMLNSLSTKTRKQYEYCISQWLLFCESQDKDPFSDSVPAVISFLTHKFNEGLSYSSLNSIRSAISLILGPQLATDERMTRFFRGIYRLRPKKPKYEDVWNPDTVLNYLSNLFPNESLSVELLTKKLVTLLALVTAHRVQTLSLICLDNININDDNINIRIPARIKTSGPNRSHPNLILPFFKENINICPATTLVSYLAVTKDLRQNCKTLLLTTRKPLHAASSATIGRWIKQTLCDSGVDVSKFSAHSTRHASTSKASEAGVSIEIIRRTAGWTNNSSTFARFYKRPIVANVNTFAEAVCSINNTND